MTRCFCVSAQDNVATLLDDAVPGEIAILGERDGIVVSGERIRLGHKVALEDIARGKAVAKFGVPIGRATADIPKGAWVHLHNCASFLDERSQSLDTQTGATTDTVYE